MRGTLKDVIEGFWEKQEKLTRDQFFSALEQAIKSGDLIRCITPIESSFLNEIKGERISIAEKQRLHLQIQEMQKVIDKLYGIISRLEGGSVTYYEHKEGYPMEIIESDPQIKKYTEGR